MVVRHATHLSITRHREQRLLSSNDLDRSECRKSRACNRKLDLCSVHASKLTPVIVTPAKDLTGTSPCECPVKRTPWKIKILSYWRSDTECEWETWRHAHLLSHSKSCLSCSAPKIDWSSWSVFGCSSSSQISRTFFMTCKRNDVTISSKLRRYTV